MTLWLAVNRVVREQRAMEKKPGRLLRPQNPSTPTDPMGPESVINDDEEPPGRGQPIPRVRYGTIVPDRHLTMETAEPWEARMQNIVRTMIQERVGVEMPPGTPRDHLRSLKLPLPTPAYTGEDDLNVFQLWLQGLLRWFSIYMLIGNAYDVSRRITIPMSLGGDALNWYNTVIDAPEGVVEWTFEDIILMMHARFITKQAAVKAAEKFRKYRYTKDMSVYKFYTELGNIASQMVEKPDQYSFKTKFLKELPREMRESIIKTRMITAEANSLEEIIKAALEYESSEKILETMAPRTGKSPTWRTYTPKEEPVHEDRKRKEEAKASTSKPTEKTKVTAMAVTKRPRDASSIECWDCHELGHRAGDPACKKPSKEPKLRAARVDDRESDSDSDEEGEGTPMDGSQYDSTESDAQSKAEGTDPDEGDQVQRMCPMRIVEDIDDLAVRAVRVEEDETQIVKKLLDQKDKFPKRDMKDVQGEKKNKDFKLRNPWIYDSNIRVAD